MELRPYQTDAVNSVYHDLREHDDNPCVVVPTAGGKTPIMAQICKDAVGRWGGRVLVLAHVKELLEQTTDKLRVVCPELAYGIYSAGLSRHDTDHDIIVAGIQSVYRRPHELGKFDLILVDECHYIPVEGDGMYRTLIAGMREISPRVRVVGLTATPYRMKAGMICGEGNVLNRVCYEIGVRELMDMGYLCKLTTKGCKVQADLSEVHTRGGEYIPTELQAVMDEERLVAAACGEIVQRTEDRKSVLIFASGIEHGKHIVNRLGGNAACVLGNTLLRDEIIDDFRNGRLKYLVNVGVLTHGFDAPNIDCVAMLRPTKSPGLYYQMCLDMETEVLTTTGWRYCHEVAIGDTVATFDVDTEEFVYVPAQDKVHRALRPGESMYGVTSPHLDIRVTDNHNMVVRSRSRSTKCWKLQTAAEAANRKDHYTIPVAGRGCRKTGVALSDAEIAFLGWYLTDGYLNKSNNTITLSQSASKFPLAIRRVLDACGFGFREYRQKRSGELSAYEDNIAFVIPQGTPRGKNSSKRGWLDLEEWINKDVLAIYDQLSSRQFGVMLEAMDLANGSHPNGLRYKRRTMDIAFGCRRRLVDRIQQLAIERGYRCNITSAKPLPSDWNKTPQRQWFAHIRKQLIAYRWYRKV